MLSGWLGAALRRQSSRALDQLLPLTLNQEKRLLTEEYCRSLGYEPPTFNTYLTLKIGGTFHLEYLRDALANLLQIHSSLRSQIVPTSSLRPGARAERAELAAKAGIVLPGTFGQRILDCPSPEVAVVDIGTGESLLPSLRESLRRDLSIPFDCERPPLLRVKVFRQAPSTTILTVIISHLVSDALSLTVIKLYLQELYNQVAHGRDIGAVIKPTAQFTDFAAWQKYYLSNNQSADPVLYWKRHWMSYGAVDNPFIGFVGTMPDVFGHSKRHCIVLDEELKGRVIALKNKRKVTVFMLGFAAFAAALHRVTQKQQITIWSNFANRTQMKYMRTVGWLVTSHMLCLDMSLCPSLDDVLEVARNQVIGAIKNQAVPTAHVWRALGRVPENAVTPGAVSFNVIKVDDVDQNRVATAGDQVYFDGFTILEDTDTAKRAISAEWREGDGEIELRLLVNKASVSEATANQVLQEWINLLQLLTLGANATICDA